MIQQRIIPMVIAAMCVLWVHAPAAGNEGDTLTIAGAVSWLENEAYRLIRESKRMMKDGTAAFPPQVGIHYKAFWLRDYEYTLEGSISSYTDKELTDACRLFVRSMRADGACVDCVKFDGTPIYKPGYGSMGKNPVADGSPFTVGVAWHTYHRTLDPNLLRDILEPLVRAMNAVPLNPETGLVFIDPEQEWDRCPYGFTDTIRKQGDVLFCSLLYVQACRQLSDLLNRGGQKHESVTWQERADQVTDKIRSVFWDPETGLFRAATVKCREHDIWGSAFAVFLGVANETQSKNIALYFKRHYHDLVQHGQVRHLPGHTYWEQGCERDQYQNGAYWATPVGWFVYTLDLVDPNLADQTVIDMVTHFGQYGACEWIYGETQKLPHYLASAALPLHGIRTMLARRAN
jgi:hypothetical protein